MQFIENVDAVSDVTSTPLMWSRVCLRSEIFEVQCDQSAAVELSLAST